MSKTSVEFIEKSPVPKLYRLSEIEPMSVFYYYDSEISEQERDYYLATDTGAVCLTGSRAGEYIVTSRFNEADYCWAKVETKIVINITNH